LEVRPPSRESQFTADLELAAAVLQKDRKATAEFVALHADALYSYIRHRLIPRLDIVDDILQDVFLAAWDNLASFRGESTLRTWLLSIARHKVEDYYRKRSKDLEVPGPEGIEALEAEFVDLQLEERIDEHWLDEKVQRTLMALPETYSLILLWRYWEKRSTRDIAVATGKTEKAVERLIARARAAFKKKWNDERL
jgi:RNA polymerase sigma-70 factor (ECF subfamily)